MKQTANNKILWSISNRFIHLNEGWRMLERMKHVKANGFNQLGKKWDEICIKCVQDCIVDGHFVISTGHFKEVYIRDFGWCIEALLSTKFIKNTEQVIKSTEPVEFRKEAITTIEFRKEAIATIEYCLSTYRLQNKVSTTISPQGMLFDFPVEGPDSLAYLVKSMYECDKRAGTRFMKNNAEFIKTQTAVFIKKFIEPETGLIRKKLHVSSIRDHAIRSSSCYDNCMAAMLADYLKKAGIKTGLDKYNYQKLIKQHFWTGKYFRDDLGENDYISADANIFPFWCRIVSSKKMLTQAIESIHQHKLDVPFPIKFIPDGKSFKKIKEAMFASRYEVDTYWTHMGPMYIDLVAKINKARAKKLAESYKKIIEKHKTYPEVLEADASPYQTNFYICDEGMLWAAMFYEVINRNGL